MGYMIESSKTEPLLEKKLLISRITADQSDVIQF